jgi:hypothetical protein
MVPNVCYQGMSRRDGIATQLLLLTDSVEKVGDERLWLYIWAFDNQPWSYLIISSVGER